jgi:hypothetical protein
MKSTLCFNHRPVAARLIRRAARREQCLTHSTLRGHCRGQYAAKPVSAYIVGKLLRCSDAYVKGLVLFSICPAAQAPALRPGLDPDPSHPIPLRQCTTVCKPPPSP